MKMIYTPERKLKWIIGETPKLEGGESSYPRRYLTQWCAFIIMNDCIRQIISSSPIPLSKIFVAPTMSAPALGLRMSLRVCMFGIFMEQRTVIRFLTLKGLRASATAAELMSAYETEALVLSTAKKWRKRSAEGRTSLYNDPRCGRSLTNHSAEAISLMLKERL
jgi:hypothetical protein